MLKYEIQSFMHLDQYSKFMAREKEKAHQIVYLPDGRKLDWYPDEEVHEFLTAYDIIEGEFVDEHATTPNSETVTPS